MRWWPAKGIACRSDPQLRRHNALPRTANMEDDFVLEQCALCFESEAGRMPVDTSRNEDDKCRASRIATGAVRMEYGFVLTHFHPLGMVIHRKTTLQIDDNRYGLT